MGETHHNAYINENLTLKPVGKLSLEEYAKKMEEAYMGISLMISPHPSYPPLEMATFGVKTITNNYENKDLSKFNKNIVSVSSCNPHLIAKEIQKLLDQYTSNGKRILNEKYLNASNQFQPIIEDILKNLQ